MDKRRKRSMTNQVGDKHTTYLSRTTIRYFNDWLKAAEISEGAPFRRVIGRGRRWTFQMEGRDLVAGVASMSSRRHLREWHRGWDAGGRACAGRRVLYIE